MENIMDMTRLEREDQRGLVSGSEVEGLEWNPALDEASGVPEDLTPREEASAENVMEGDEGSGVFSAIPGKGSAPAAAGESMSVRRGMPGKAGDSPGRGALDEALPPVLEESGCDLLLRWGFLGETIKEPDSGMLEGDSAAECRRMPGKALVSGTPSPEELAGLEEGMGALPSTELAVRNLWMSDFFLPGLGAESDVIVTGAGALWRLGEELAIEESAEGLKAAARARGEREEREDVLFDLGESRDTRFEAGLSLGITGS